MKLSSYLITNRILIAVTLLLGISSCKKEAALVASEDNKFYKLPQGNQPYDQQILAFYNKYKTVILYNFSTVDFIYAPAGPFDPTASAVPAGPVKIQETLDFLQQHLFNAYSEEFLQKVLPFKILLASEAKIQLQFPFDPVPVPAIAGYNHITFGLNGQLDGMSAGALDTARGFLHSALLRQAVSNSQATIPPTFRTLAAAGLSSGFDQIKQNGVFVFRTNNTVYSDFGDYIRVITSTHINDLNTKLFTAQNDPKGMFKKKYNAIVSYFLQNYDIDLQAIGNL